MNHSKNHVYIVAAMLGTSVVLWQMLMPGYVLTLDLVLGPHQPLIFDSGRFLNLFPIWAIVSSLEYLIAGWIVEKIILIALVFCLFYIPLRWLPVPRKWGAEYVAAALFAVNPFVYERMLGGQWLVVAGYALLPLFLKSLVDLWTEQTWRKALMPFVWLFVIGVFSLHFLVMASLVYVAYAIVLVIYKLVNKEAIKDLIIRTLTGGAALLVASSYWILPYLLHPQESILNAFDQSNWQAFHTASDATLGTVGNVATLYGFWEEHEMWADYFVFPKGTPLFWIGLVLLTGLILLGVYALLKEKDMRLRAAGFAAVAAGVVGFVFSLGLGDSFVYPLNHWLFEHVSFWRGFRDTEKWSGWLALMYAVLTGFGSAWILERVGKKEMRDYVLIALVCIPLVYTYMMLGGFSRQLQPVWYPESWKEADAVLAADPDCKALFLPWHLYYSLSFNHSLITASPASRYFSCTIVSSQNMEVGSARTGSVSIENGRVDAAIVAGEQGGDTIKALRDEGIRYVVVTNDIQGIDPYKYPWLSSKNVKLVLHRGDLSLYDISGTVVSE